MTDATLLTDRGRPALRSNTICSGLRRSSGLRVFGDRTPALERLQNGRSTVAAIRNFPFLRHVAFSNVGELVGVKVLDHVIIGKGRYVSFVDDGYW